MRTDFVAVAFALLLLLPALGRAEPATLIRASELKSAPATDAATLAQLAQDAAVETLERSGGWVRVKAPAGEGWVRMLSLRYNAAASVKTGDSGIAELFNVARTGSSGTQVTTGVRGLDAEQIATAKPDAAQLSRLDGYSASREEALGFAREGKLEAQAVAYPAP
jgi:hypothetical protein